MLAAPNEDWRSRPDLDVQGTGPFRASLVARARFVEDAIVTSVDSPECVAPPPALMLGPLRER